MKKILLFLIYTFAIITFSSAQSPSCGIFYEYNAAGQRVKSYYDCKVIPATGDAASPIVNPGPIVKPSMSAVAGSTPLKDSQVETSDLKIIVYPNPASWQYSISFSMMVREVPYYLCDMKGVAMKSGIITGSSYEQDIKGLPAGFYVLTMMIEKKRYSFKIIIVN